MITPRELAALDDLLADEDDPPTFTTAGSPAPAPQIVATPNSSGALQHSCTPPATGVQPLCKRLTRLHQSLRALREQTQREIDDIIRAQRALDYPDHRAVMSGLTELTMEMAQLEGYLLDTTLHFRFKQ